MLALYLPSVRFGLIWDDPTWYGQGAGQSAWQIFTSLSTYQFYRPLAILLNQHLIAAEGVVNAPRAHLMQIGAHLAAALLVVPALTSLGLERRQARLAAALFAICPLSYQAVAWQAPQQPPAMMWLLAATALAGAYARSRRRPLLGLSLAAYAAAMLSQESAVPFGWVFFWIAYRSGGASNTTPPQRQAWPWAHAALAAAYLLAWLLAPRRAGVTGAGFQFTVLGYLLQGVAHPLAWAAAPGLAGWPLNNLIALFAAAGLALVFLAGRLTSWRSAGLASALVLSGLLPVWAGLSWEYVQIGARLLYPASLGIAALWAGLGSLAWGQGLARRAAGLALLAALAWASLEPLGRLHGLTAEGTQHLGQAVEQLAARPQGRLAFVNFPDRLEIRRPLYPLGFWGLTLAPVVQDLGDYARAERGQGAQDRSLAAILTGAAQRHAWSYRVDMRGADSPPERLMEAAAWADQVFLTEYLAAGQLRLRPVGYIRPAGEAGFLARWEDAVQLIAAEPEADSPGSLRLTWRCLRPLGLDDTLFVHLWRDGVFVAARDGDSLGELVPPLAWLPGVEIVDIRALDLTGLEPGRYELRVGIYNRGSGLRYAAFAPDGRRWPEDEAPAGSIDVP